MKTTFQFRSKPFSELLPAWFRATFMLLLWALTFTTQAQTKLWDKTLGGSSKEELKLVKQTQDGGYMLGGSSSSGISGDKAEASRGGEDYWIVKLKADGTKAWDKTFGGNENETLTYLQQTRDGGYILGGYSYSGKSGDKSEANKGGINEFGSTTSDYWVVKIDANGNKQWDKAYGGDNFDYLITLQQTSDGGYILGGHSESGVSGDKSQPSNGWWDLWVLKINANGTKVWDKSFGETDYDELISLAITPDGGYVLAGNFRYNNARIIKLKADGTKFWEKSLDIYSVTSFQPTADGGYILGYSTTPYPPDYGIIKLKADGTQVWNKTFGGINNDWFTSLQQTKDGGYILGGSSDSGISGDKTERVQGPTIKEDSDQDYWVIKLKADGTKEWDKTIGGNNYERLATVLQTSDGNYILGGYSSSEETGVKSEANRGWYDYWVVKLDNKIRQNQNVTFAPILLNKAVGDPPFTLSAEASSGLPITFKVVSGPATVSNNKVTLTGAGTVNLQAYQAGNAAYNPAVADQSFIVEEKKLVQIQWDKTLGGYNPDVLTAMVATPDGGYLAGGYSVSSKSGDKSTGSKGGKDYWIVKLNGQGSKVWDKAYGGNKADSLTAIMATPDGGYLLGGSSASGISGDKSQASKGITDYWLVKIDAAGKKLWDQSYGGSAADNLTSLLATSDGSYLLGGTSASGLSGDKSQGSKGKSDYWLVRINANGKKTWDKTYGGSQADKLTALVTSPDGGFLVGGSSASGKGGDKSQVSQGLEDYWALRLREDGTKLWDKTFGGIKEIYQYFDCYAEDPADCYFEAGSSVLTALLPIPDGGYLLGGYSNAGKGGNKTSDNLSKYNLDYETHLNDYWVVKIDSKGTQVWDKTFGGINVEKSRGVADIYFTGNSVLRTMVATPDGNYLLAGTSNSNKGRDKSENTRGGEIIKYPIDDHSYNMYTLDEEDYWLIKIDGEGTKKWDRTIGSRDYDELAAVVTARDDGYVLAGSSAAFTMGGDKTEVTRDTSFMYDSGKRDYWVVKVKDETPPVTSAWNRRYGGSGNDGFTAIIKTSDGDYLSGGYSNSGLSGDKTQSSQGRNDFWVVKSDKNGKKLWDKRYGGSGDDYLTHLISTQDGGYLLAGSSLSGISGDKSQASRGDRDYWVVKISNTGVKQWDKRFGGSGYDELKKVQQLSTGEYLLAGYSNSPTGGDKSQGSQGGNDYWLVKISSTGAKIWDKRYGGNLNDALSNLVLTSDGGYLLGGSSLSGKSGNKSEVSRGGSDFWLVRLDKSGNQIWDKTYGGTGQDKAYSLGIAGSDYYISGQSNSPAGADKTRGSQGGIDFWFLKITSTGSKIWDKRFGGEKDDELRACIQTRDGGYLLAGKSFSGKSGNKTQTSQGSSDYWLVKTDANGMYQWDKRYGGSGAEELRAVTQTNEGALLLAGKSESGVSGDRSQPSQGGMDYWLVKVAPETTTIIAQREATLAEEPRVKTELSLLNAYPNPFTANVTTSFTLPETQPVSVKVYDTQGNEVATLYQGEAQASQAYQLQWLPQSHQPAGIYILRLQTPRSAQTQRIILIK